MLERANGTEMMKEAIAYLLSKGCHTYGYGKTRFGLVKVRVEDIRRTGDPQTSVGNSLVNMYLHFKAFNRLGIQPKLCLILGDDNLSIFRIEDRSKLEQIDVILKEYGM